MKSWFFKKIKKIDKSVVRLIKEKKERAHTQMKSESKKEASQLTAQGAKGHLPVNRLDRPVPGHVHPTRRIMKTQEV